MFKKLKDTLKSFAFTSISDDAMCIHEGVKANNKYLSRDETLSHINAEIAKIREHQKMLEAQNCVGMPKMEIECLRLDMLIKIAAVLSGIKDIPTYNSYLHTRKKTLAEILNSNEIFVNGITKSRVGSLDEAAAIRRIVRGYQFAIRNTMPEKFRKQWYNMQICPHFYDEAFGSDICTNIITSELPSNAFQGKTKI